MVDAELRAAIEATIVRWAKIATAKNPQREHRHSGECPLCIAMNSTDCEYCPAYDEKEVWDEDVGCDWPWSAVNIPPRLAAWAVHDFAVSLLYQEEE